ncbi:hypothetical protein DPMN_194501 [Dreissena polymorpha]|uniref:Uncharacterized protein n=1 Tax=Dreissena polymorpha TaxID=45954 RepID=A0A9D3Y2K6_DREPO|nr:hypothetical protein DPMN_194501 [Dreissena polymorpha]
MLETRFPVQTADVNTLSQRVSAKLCPTGNTRSYVSSKRPTLSTTALYFSCSIETPAFRTTSVGYDKYASNSHGA